MAISDHWHRVSKIRATIMAVDPKNNIIDVRGGDGGNRRVMVWEVPDAFIWPKDGEDWSIYEQNGSWYLGDRINSPLDSISIMDLQPGDQRLGGIRTIAREIQIQSEDEAMLNFYDTGGPVDRKRSRLINAGGYTYLQAPNDAYSEVPTTGFRYDHASGHVLFEHGASTDVSVTETGEVEPWELKDFMPVRDVGVKGQICAGRQYDWSEDFLAGDLDVANVWNLGGVSDFTKTLSHIGVDSGVTQHHLTARGPVALGPGILGETGTAAVFHGSATEALYYTNPGNSGWTDFLYGSVGCWFRTAKRGVVQALMSEWREIWVGRNWYLGVEDTNQVVALGSTDGNNMTRARGGPDVCDDRWHFAVMSFDGSYLRVFVDGYQVASTLLQGPLYSSQSPFNIGAFGADSSTSASNPFYGYIDEAFRLRPAINEDQVRFLYAARIPHSFPAMPTRVSISVQNRRRGAPLAIEDFPTPPKYYYPSGTAVYSTNLGTGAGTVSQLSDPGLGPMGSANGTGAQYFNGTSHVDSVNAPAADLPHSIATRSAGCWFKCNVTTPHAGSYGLICLSGVDVRYLYISYDTKQVSIYDTVSIIQGGPMVADGFWHHAVSVSDNYAFDGLRHKIYLDGKLIASSTLAVNAASSAVPTGLMFGNTAFGSEYFPGMLGGVFVCDYALSARAIHHMYSKAGYTGLDPSPKNSGDHVVGITENSVLVDFSTLDGCDLVNVKAAA